jgi:hypothetical protein
VLALLWQGSQLDLGKSTALPVPHIRVVQPVPIAAHSFDTPQSVALRANERLQAEVNVARGLASDLASQANTANRRITRIEAAQRGARHDALTIGWIAAIVVLVSGVAIAMLFGLRLRRSPTGRTDELSRSTVAAPRRAPGGVPASESEVATTVLATPDRNGHLDRDRAALIRTCMDIGDIVPSEALRVRLRDALNAVGVQTVSADEGAPFDPTHFRMVDSLPTSNPALDHRVARTERVGYVDRGRRIRDPEVLVYRLEEPK